MNGMRSIQKRRKSFVSRDSGDLHPCFEHHSSPNSHTPERVRTNLRSAPVVLLLLLICGTVAVLLAWPWSRSADNAPFAITFLGATNSMPRVRGHYGLFGITNRSSSAVIMLPNSRWSYENGSTSYAALTPTATNVFVTLKPHEGFLLTFGQATNMPCRLEIEWIRGLAKTWLKVPLSIRRRLPANWQGVRGRYQASGWIRERGLIDGPPQAETTR
jgi:hypothetical protein